MDIFAKPAVLGQLGCAALLAMLVFFLSFGFQHVSATDPDRYFHLAVSRTTTPAGTVLALPQADDLDWAKSFPDKEYLFHVLTSLAYRMGGEKLVLVLIPLLATSIVVMLFWASAQTLPLGWALFGTVGFTFLCPAFYYRMLFLRPHVLAVALFVLALLGILRKKPWLVFIAIALFALAYHALFIPFTLIGAALLFGLLGGRTWQATFAAGGAGLILGILANPHYPQNIQMMFTVMAIAVDPELNKMLDGGIELLPLPAVKYFRLYAAHWGLVLFAAVTLVRRRKELRQLEALQRLGFLTLLSGIFLVMTLQSPRATEYATPCCVLLFAEALTGRKSRMVALYSSVVFFFLFEGPSFLPLYGRLFEKLASATQTESTLLALEALPAGAAGEKVYNCEWYLGSYILYSRPDVRFVDLIDPHFLFETTPEKAVLRMKLNFGVVSDAHSIISHTFKAQYVLCVDRRVVAILKQDRRFQQLYPKVGDAKPLQHPAPYLFAVKKQ